MQNKPVMGIMHEWFGDNFNELVFYGARVFAGGKLSAIRKPKYVGVYRHGGLSKGDR